MKKLMFFVVMLTAFFCTNAKAAPDAPKFSLPGGFYENTIEVSLTGSGDIYYTLDGSAPTTQSNLYTQPIVINPTQTAPPKGVNIRAAVITGGETSYVSSNTYFVGSGMFDYVGEYPFVNLIADPYDYWDEQNGIYTNYKYEHKVPAVFHYITTKGQTEINRLVEIKVSGNGSRSYAKKSLRVYFKKTDPTQSKYLEYDLIPSANVDFYSKVTFRISDWSNTNIKDPLAQKIAKSLNLDIADSTPMILFLNGEYWGLYECREQHDEEYLSAHYGIDKDNFVYFDRGSTEPVVTTKYNGITYKDKFQYAAGPEDGNEDGLKGETFYRENWDKIKYLVQNSDITSDEVYNQFCSMVDVDNFIDYTIVYLFSGNDDWPGNNFRAWRVTEEAIDPNVEVADGKWRFLVHDFDLAFDSVSHNTIRSCSTQHSGSSPTRHAEFATVFYQNLLKNEDFRSELCQRISVYFSTKLSAASVKTIVDSLVSAREDGKSADLTRWNLGTFDKWKSNTAKLSNFASQRPSYIYNHFTALLNENYSAGITGTATATVTSTLPCNINGADLSSNMTVTLFAGIPATVRANNGKITIVQNGTTVTGLGEVTFVPSGTCTITIEPQDAYIKSAKIENGILTIDIYASESVGENTKIFLVGFNQNKSISFIKNITDFETNLNGNNANSYKIFIWDGFKPVSNYFTVKPQ